VASLTTTLGFTPANNRGVPLCCFLGGLSLVVHHSLIQLHVVELFFVDTFCQVLGALEQSITILFSDDTGTS